jgi:hypothetical protein
MPETSEQSAPLELLSDQIQELFSWHRSRAKCMASMNSGHDSLSAQIQRRLIC